VIDARDLDPETLLGLSNERDKWLARLLAAERAAFLRGVARGRQLEAAERDTGWNRIARVALGLSHREMESRRWGPIGSEHFGDPRPGDFVPRKRAA
jgi:hypothetical protein